MGKLLTIIIPAYNEEKSLQNFFPSVIQFCNDKGFNLIVINDGSKDKTQNIIEKYLHNKNLRLVNNKVNKGYGGAIKTGILEADTKYIITIDADGQHYLEDVENLYKEIIDSDADMIIGSRKGTKQKSYYRRTGKWLIRMIAKILMPLNIYDINSGMKIYNTAMAKKYLRLCPDSMAYSDIIALVFVNQRHLVLEIPISIKPRNAGNSTINTKAAVETMKEILNIVILFNPMRIFMPVSLFFILSGIGWGLPIILAGRGVSVGAMLGIVTGIIFFFLGLIAEQLSLMRKESIS